MAVDYTTPNTGAALSAMDANSVRKLWQKTVDMFEQTEDFFTQFEGTTKASPIAVKTDTSKGGGQKITITTRAGYYGEGKSGDASFEAAADFEEDEINSYTLEVDFLRNATSMNDRTEEVLGMRGELMDGSAAELGKWMGREKTWRMMMLFREKGGSGNLVYANGRLSQDEILSSDGLSYDEIISTRAQLEPMGGRPAMVGRDGAGNAIHRYLVVGTSAGLLSLEVDPDYKDAVKEAAGEGSGNPLFKGGFVDVGGNVIKKFNPIDHDGSGPIGSPWNPKALLGVAITAGTTAIEIKGGGNATRAAKTAKKYFKFFPGYAFEFLPSDILSPASETRYLLIINPRSGVGGDGKIGMYAYTTGNDGNKITITQRLGSAASGARVTTLGEVTWNTGVWAGKHTDAHPEGAIVVPCNAKGVPIGDTVILGASAALRGYGKYRNRRTEQHDDGDFLHRRYITSVFGQTLRKDVLNRAPGYIRIRHAVSYPGLGLPTVQ